MNKTLSIIVPCYNESKNIPLILERFSEVAKTNVDVEVLLVNNGSTDDSTKVFEQELAKPEHSFARMVNVAQNIGYGHGIMSGLRAATGDVLAWTHADMQTDPVDVLTAYNKFIELNDPDHVIVKGKRINRRFGEWFFTLGMSCIASTVLMKPLYDINAQPKLFHRHIFEKMQNAPDDFSLDLYLLYMAQKKGYRLHTIPVKFPDRIYGESKWAFSFSSRYKTVLRTIKYIILLHTRIQ